MLEILYEIVFSPRSGFRKAIKKNSYLEPLILVLVIGLINGLSISSGRDQGEIVSLLYAFALLIFWFTQSAFLNLIGELLGGERGGKKLFICIGYAIFPFLFLAPFHFQPESIFVGFSLLLLIWATYLSILALEKALNLPFRKAVFAVLLPFVIYILISFAGGPLLSSRV